MPYRHPAPLKSITGGNSSGNLRRGGKAASILSLEEAVFLAPRSPCISLFQRASTRQTMERAKTKRSLQDQHPRRYSLTLSLSLPVAGDQNAVRAKLRTACVLFPRCCSLFSHQTFTAPYRKICCALFRIPYPYSF
jgi:hypothetical protein